MDALLTQIRSEIESKAHWIEDDWAVYPDSDLTCKVSTLLFQSAFNRPVEIECDAANRNAAFITFLGVPRPIAFGLTWQPAPLLGVAMSFVLPYYGASHNGTRLEAIESVRSICARNSLNVCKLLEEAGYTFLPASIADAEVGRLNGKASNGTVHSLLFI